MPATSQAQQRFFGLVRAVQKGDRSLDSVDPHVAQTAKKMTPKDVREFAHTKRKGLPETKDPAEVKKPVVLKQAAALDIVALILKQASLDATLNRTRKAIDQASQARNKNVKAYADSMQKHNEMLTKKLHEAQTKSVQAEQKAQQATIDAKMQQQQAAGAEGAMPMPDPLPPGQPPYGTQAVLQQQMAQQAQQGKGDAAVKFPKPGSGM